MSGRTAELMLGPMRSIRRAAIIWGVSLAAIVFLTVAIWPAFRGSTSVSQVMDQLPEGVVKAFGLEGFGTPAGFLRGNLYDFFIPLLLAGAAVGFVNSLTAGEEDSGRLEMILAQPVKRHGVFAGRAFAAFACVALITLLTSVVQFASDAIFDLQIGTDRLLATLILCGLLALLNAGLAIAVAGLTGKPALVLGIGLLAVVGGCFAAALLPLSGSLAEFAHVSPWDWAFSGDPLVNATEIWRYLALGVPAFAMAAVGVWAFGRRDLAAA